MINAFEILVALRYLRTKRKDGFITVVNLFSMIGIALGVATLIVVMSVMNGYRVELINRILGINGHITIIGRSASIEEVRPGEIPGYEGLTRAISYIPGVTYAAPLITGQGMIIGNDQSSGVMVRGMNVDSIRSKPLLASALGHEALNNFTENQGLLIGKALAEGLGVTVGDNIKIVTPEVSITIAGLVPRVKTFKVAGIFDVGMYEYNAYTVFMPLAEAQRLFRYANSVNNIEVMTENPEKLQAIKRLIIDAAHQQKLAIDLIDWDRANESMQVALKVERNVMFLILTLMILVAAFNIISSLIMLVKDKTKSIAILRALGADYYSIIRIFVLCGSIIGFVGTLLGATIGVVFALNIESIRRFLESLSGTTLFDPMIYYLTKLPSQLDVGSVCMIVGTSLALSILATIYPAYKAAKLTPARALRYEG
jgi:lipoprotein-releasing system permease protein